MAFDRTRILERRKAEGKTLEDVASVLGVSRQTVQRYESGEIKRIDTLTIEKLSQALNCSPAYLMGWTDIPHDITMYSNDNIYELSILESHLVDSFRKLDKDGQTEAIDFIDFKAHKSKSVLRDKPATTIIDDPFQVRAAHAHNPNSDGSELEEDFALLEEAVRNDKLRKNGKQD